MNEGRSIRFAMLVSPSEERRQNALKIKEQIPELELVYADIKKQDLFMTHLNTLRTESGGVCMMEDDLKLCRNFRERFDAVIDKHSGDIVQFFERAMAKNPLSRGWQPGGQFYSCVCYYMPAEFTQVLCNPKWINKFKNWFLGKGEHWTYPIDAYIQYVLGSNKMVYWRELPYLVQHLDFKSMMGSRSTKRQSKYFIDDLEGDGYAGIDKND